MKKYVLIAGVNGAGKSTLYQILQSLQKLPRVNADEILREFGDWRNPVDVATAGKIAAKKQGYFVEMHYVGLEQVEIAKKRVSERVKQGGHGILESEIDRRYKETFQNLEIVLPDCDLAAFYDNTHEFRRFAIYQNGSPIRISQNVPQWYKYNVLKLQE